MPILKSLEQREHQVFRRVNGGKLGPWDSLKEGAKAHWPYANAACAAYQKGMENHPLTGEKLLAFNQAAEHLSYRGWKLWSTLPQLGEESSAYPALAEAMKESHLRAQVWDNGSEIIVAFGGTKFTSLEDTRANFRWFLPFSRKEDQYSVLVEHFAPAFKAELVKQAGLDNAPIVATGHSLGGGLAECFAYACDASQGCHEVYAFDPSPVSGKRDGPAFVEHARLLTINRLYRRDEALAPVRSLLQLLDPGDDRNQGQTWIDYRYMFDWKAVDVVGLPWLQAELHGMLPFAHELYEQAQQ